jgi:hypothetical protein
VQAVKPIRQPVPPRPGASLFEEEDDEALEAEIAELEEALRSLGPAAGQGETKAQDMVRHHVPRPAPETIGTPPAGEAPKPEDALHEVTSLKTKGLEKEAMKKPPLDLGKEVKKMEETEGRYVVWEADTLPAIAARENVYGDPLKWPILYRLNADMLGALNLQDDFDTKVPAGFKLKTLPSDDQKAVQSLDSPWIVNVLSSPSEGKVAPLAIKLIKNGYSVYITRAEVKGKEWMRLRVGFFPNREEANTEAEKIRALLGLDDSWVTKAAKKELQQFASY